MKNNLIIPSGNVKEDLERSKQIAAATEAQLQQEELQRRKDLKKKEKEEKERQARTLEQFLAFLEDESYFEDYSPYELLGHDMLIRVFRYKEPKKPQSPITLHTSLTSDETLTSPYDRNFAVAKVISVGPKVTLFTAGDVVTLPEGVAGSSFNPDYKQWLEDSEAAQNSRPPGKVGPPPPKYVDNLISWSKYMFKANKISPTMETDYLTFLIPDTLPRTKIKTDE